MDEQRNGLESEALESVEQEPQAPEIIEQVWAVDGVGVVDVTGEVDLSTAPQLKDGLMEAAAVAGPNVIVNLARVSYMDSSGFGTLLGATKKLRPLGGSIHLVGANANIERMLVITRLNTIFILHQSIDEAVAAIRGVPNGQQSAA